MSAVRTDAETVPEVEVRREADGRDGVVVWVVRRCAFCRRRHTHLADPVLTTAVIPARCNPTRFYRVQEVAK
ncbi:hypothetical protein PV733_07315 [Streptomyces europaeiscabiei]|uniref:hypothetical protein n=1 Tax=Streptomyces europaeiscabiei TaxID=146819 RepID=UPI0029A54F8F|nr:hypothetical protein [Streptomyces europaeiscabiei]MDX3708783.1 hypothetical protein [Streptomyces europaeiscabiei]